MGVLLIPIKKNQKADLPTLFGYNHIKNHVHYFSMFKVICKAPRP